MKVKREWNDQPNLFDAVVEALSTADFRDSLAQEHHVRSHQGEGAYGEEGIMVIEVEGRRFYVELHEDL